MRGSPVYQVNEVFNQIKQFGSSKHAAKEEARSRGAKGWHEIGQEVGIYSYNTANNYTDICINVFKFAKEHYKVRDIELITGEHAAAFLKSKVDEEIAHATMMKYAAAIEKLQMALNVYASKNRTGKTYNFSEALSPVRQDGHEKLERFDRSRAYQDQRNIIQSLEDSRHQMIASIQLYGGCRIREVGEIDTASFAKVKDPYLGDEKGSFTVKGKGGKIRRIYVPLDLFNKVTTYFSTNNLQLTPAEEERFRSALKSASVKSGQEYQGTHGLRWNFAQKRMSRLQSDGNLVYEQALVVVSQEMGHERAEITEHYLR